MNRNWVPECAQTSNVFTYTVKQYDVTADDFVTRFVSDSASFSFQGLMAFLCVLFSFHFVLVLCVFLVDLFVNLFSVLILFCFVSGKRHKHHCVCMQ